MPNIKNFQIRFNLDNPEHFKAWDYLNSFRRTQYKSISEGVIKSVIANYERQQMLNEPYLETREKENQFVERIVNEVEKVIENNLPSFILTCIGNLANGRITTEYTAPEEDISNSEDIDWDFIGND